MKVIRPFANGPTKQEDRKPCESYDDAINRLVVIRCTEGIGDEAYKLAIQLVADIYWVNDKRVTRDVYVASRKLFPGADDV